MAVCASRRAAWALGAIVVTGAALRLAGLWFGLPHAQARPDESTALGHAIAILQGDLNPHFFHWPSLYLYILAGVLGVASAVRDALGTASDTPSYAQLCQLGRACAAVAGTATIPVLFLLAKPAMGRSVALVAAALLAVAPLHVRDSHFVMADVPMTLLVTAALWLLLEAVARLDRPAVEPGSARPGLRTMALAGLVAGLAASTKYSAAAILLPALVAQVWLAMHADGRRWRVWLPGALFAACFALGFLAGTPYAVLDFAGFRTDVLFDFTHLAGGHGPALGRGWQRHLSFSLPYGLGVPIFAASVLGVFTIARHGRRTALILGSFVVAFAISIGTGLTVFARYIMPLVPVWCLLAADAIDWLGRRAAGRVRLGEATTIAAIAALVAAPSLVTSAWTDVLLRRSDTRVLAARWLSSHLPADSTLFESGREYVSLDIVAERLHRWRYSPETGHFEGATADMLPGWLVLHRSPLVAYTPIPEPVERLARERYAPVAVLRATTDDSRAGDYDQQDAFFVPMRNLRYMLRPGTNIEVYKRRE